jgi:hypothetical protein
MRIARREPHLKYHIPKNKIPAGMVAEWKALTVKGMSNRDHLIEVYRAGWQPARAEQFPEFSGFGINFGDRTLQIGISPEGAAIYLENVKAGDPIVLDGQILMLRPEELNEEAHDENKRRAVDDVAQQIARLSGRSREQIGAQLTKVTREFVGKGGNVDDA